jgi:hypothetical protein
MSGVKEIVPPTPERVAKGDLNKWRIDELLERGILTQKQHAVCRRYIVYHHAGRRIAFRSCLDVRIGGVATVDDSFMVNPLHFTNLFDTIRGALSPAAQKWLQYVVLDGDSLTEAVGKIGLRKASAKAGFLAAVDELMKAMEA